MKTYLLLANTEALNIRELLEDNNKCIQFSQGYYPSIDAALNHIERFGHLKK